MNTIALENAVKEADKALQNVYFKLKEAYPRGTVVMFGVNKTGAYNVGVVDDYEYSINSEMGKEGNLMVVCNGEIRRISWLRVNAVIPVDEISRLAESALAYKK